MSPDRPPGFRARALMFALAAILPGVTARADPGPTAPGSEREVIIVNHAQRSIDELFVSRSTADDWGEERLNDRSVARGQSLRLRLGRVRDCAFDIQVIYDDASKEERRGVDLCRNREAVFDGSAAVAAPADIVAEHTVTVINRSPRPIQQVYVSPAESSQWGDDLLTKGTISVGARAEVVYRGNCAADLRVVFENRAAEERRGLDLCRTPALLIVPGWTTSDEPMVPRAEQLHIVNQSGRAISALYVFPPGSAKQGPDLLAGHGLADGAEADAPFDPGSACGFSARAVHDDATTDQAITTLDVCQSRRLVLGR